MHGRPRWLLAAGPLFALCLYTYGPAKLFVPLFLLGAVLVYARRLWAVRRWVALGLLLAMLTAAPVIVFDFAPSRSLGAVLQPHDDAERRHSRWRENAARVWDQYTRFFSRSFLFERGDPLLRHAVPGFGELYWCMLPLLGLGRAVVPVAAPSGGKLFLWWLVLYPIAPALMNEAPSASRGIIGVGGVLS